MKLTGKYLFLFTAIISLIIGCNSTSKEKNTLETDENGYAILTDEQVENLVNRSYQYVAMYNVNNKFAQKQGGWNTTLADTALLDHTTREIARPNNDTYYTSLLLDLTQEPMIIDVPVFDSKYVSLMVTGYDHFVNIPMSTRLGDFKKLEKILFYTSRSKGYHGEEIKGIDRYFEATGDFISAVFRVMPHANEPERYKKVINSMLSVKLISLSEFQGKEKSPSSNIQFPLVGKTDADVFENNLLEVIQFVFNHTTFDPSYPDDKALLEIYKPLGIVPGNKVEESNQIKIDGEKFREVSLEIQQKWLSKLSDPETYKELQPKIFQPKGKTDLETLIAVSIIGPIGVPMEEALYPQVSTADGEQMNAMYDYVIRMSKDELPPANAFWSLTLYDLEQGFFIPNDYKKYSVGENAGMKLNSEGGIEIFITDQKPDGVSVENWLPIERKNLNLSPQIRVYVPNLEKMKTWQSPTAEKIE